MTDENGQFSHEKIKEVLTAKFKSLLYFCMSDEIGLEEKTPHTHLFICFSSNVRFSQVQKYFPHARVISAKGSCQHNYEYISKTGKKWGNDEKCDTSVEGTLEEWGEMPVEKQGSRNDLKYLYDMVKDGWTNIEILERSPDFLINLTDIERVRQTLKEHDYKDVFRELLVTYIYGVTNVGKTRYVMETYGYSNVYRVTDYKHPFDGYKGQNVILFDEFSGNLRIQDMNNYLDGYPLELPCRYVNKQACYEIVYIISNIDLHDLYKLEQDKYQEVFNAFIRRIHKVIHFHKDGSRHEYETGIYLSGNIELDPANEKDNPFTSMKKDTAKFSRGEQINMPEELPVDGDLPF